MIAAMLSKAIISYDSIYRSMKSPLTIPQVLVLMHLAEETTVSEVFVREQTGLSRQTINDIIHRIKKRGFVERTSGGRPKKTRLTSTGRVALYSALGAVAKTDEEFLRLLPPAERKKFTSLLTTMTNGDLSQILSPDD